MELVFCHLSPPTGFTVLVFGPSSVFRRLVGASLCNELITDFLTLSHFEPFHATSLIKALSQVSKLINDVNSSNQSSAPFCLWNKLAPNTNNKKIVDSSKHPFHIINYI